MAKSNAAAAGNAAPNKSKKKLVIILCIVLALAIAGGVAFFVLRAKPEKAAVIYAPTAWQQIGRTEAPQSISCMHFGDNELTARIEDARPDASVALVPEKGYAYLFAPTGAGLEGLTMVFLTDGGQFASTLVYNELVALADSTQCADYLNAANFIASLYVDAMNHGTPFGNDDTNGTWYTFTEAQIQTATAAR